MRIGRLIGGAILGVGAIVAAPIVAPVAGAVAAAGAATAATVGTAVTGAAATAAGAVATVGSAAAGVAATAGTAATGAAAAVGTAVGSTAVGSAVTGVVSTAAGAVASSTVGSTAIGAMATVGHGVGTVAGAVGMSGVASVTGTTAGAAAVGTITTSGVIGVTTAVDGVNKIQEASEIKYEAEDKYDTARRKFNQVETDTNKQLKSLGSIKLKAWNNLGDFVEVYKRINNIEALPKELNLDKELSFDENELADVEIVALSVKEAVKGSVASLTAGNLIGLATSTGFTSIATASTGTAIAGLHGAAATNASLAALGGGSLSAGGLGMAGGAVVANALTLAPAAAIGGIFLKNKGSKNLDDAHAMRREVNKLVEKMETAKSELKRLGNLARRIELQIKKYNQMFERKLDWMRKKVTEETDFRKYTMEEKKNVFTTGQLATILKDLTCAQLMTEGETPEVVEDKTVDSTIIKCNNKWDNIQSKLK